MSRHISLYRGIFRTLMVVEYSKPCQISKMMKRIENPGTVRAVYSGISKYIQGHSTTCSTFQPFSGILRDIRVYRGIFRYYLGILSYVQTYSDVCVTLIYTTVLHSEL